MLKAMVCFDLSWSSTFKQYIYIYMYIYLYIYDSILTIGYIRCSYFQLHVCLESSCQIEKRCRSNLTCSWVTNLWWYDSQMTFKSDAFEEYHLFATLSNKTSESWLVKGHFDVPSKYLVPVYKISTRAPCAKYKFRHSGGMFTCRSSGLVMETFSVLLAICAGNSPICTWINGCVNNGETGDLRRHHFFVYNRIPLRWYDACIEAMPYCQAVPNIYSRQLWTTIIKTFRSTVSSITAESYWNYLW